MIALFRFFSASQRVSAEKMLLKFCVSIDWSTSPNGGSKEDCWYFLKKQVWLLLLKTETEAEIKFFKNSFFCDFGRLTHTINHSLQIVLLHFGLSAAAAAAVVKYSDPSPFHTPSSTAKKERNSLFTSFVSKFLEPNANARLIVYHHKSPGFARVKSYEWWYTCAALLSRSVYTILGVGIDPQNCLIKYLDPVPLEQTRSGDAKRD